MKLGSNLFCLMLLALVAYPSGAEPRREISVRLNGAEVLELPAGTSEAFLADPTIADLENMSSSSTDPAASPSPVSAEVSTSFYLYGKKLGRTTLVYKGASGGKEFRGILDLNVVPDIAALQNAILAAAPDSKVEVAGTPQGLVLSGEVKSPNQAATVKMLASHYVSDENNVIDNMKLAASAQVNIKVHFAEVEKNYGDYLHGDFTINRIGGTSTTTIGGTAMGLRQNFVDESLRPIPFLNSQGVALPGVAGIFSENGYNVYAMLSALEQAGKATILAEPNLTALSGQTAKFIAGGEFPIPISAENNRVTVSYKEYGIKLSFTPVVLSESLISLRVAAEVSELTDEGGVSVDQITIRGIKTRRAETSVELGSGQSFSIAGLVRSTDISDERKVPLLGDLPILGSLFRSESFRNNTSELVVVVTPYVVEPVDDFTQIASPLEGVEFENIFEKLWHGGLPKHSPQMPKPAGDNSTNNSTSNAPKSMAKNATKNISESQIPDPVAIENKFMGGFIMQ